MLTASCSFGSSHWPPLSDANHASMLRQMLPGLTAPTADATDFTPLCEASRSFGRRWRAGGAQPEHMVIALKAALATSYGSTPSLADVDEAVAFAHHVAPAAHWYPLALTAALDGFFE